MNKVTSHQARKNLKERTNRLFKAVDKDLKDFSINFKYIGSITTPEGPTKKKDGSYDIDVDLVTSSKLSAQDTYDKLIELFNKHKRKFEVITKRDDRNAILKIVVDDSGNYYYIDVAVIKQNTGEYLKKVGQQFKWEK